MPIPTTIQRWKLIFSCRKTTASIVINKVRQTPVPRSHLEEASPAGEEKKVGHDHCETPGQMKPEPVCIERPQPPSKGTNPTRVKIRRSPL
ncbi:MAG: hypothetical protein Ct9H300mP16_10680 [Pseudomonadota bacterium]|nr:MAG: hypothetical protein Ct9H300mP16_10680 [Pseudomonadota bacterium]